MRSGFNNLKVVSIRKQGIAANDLLLSQQEHMFSGIIFGIFFWYFQTKPNTFLVNQPKMGYAPYWLIIQLFHVFFSKKGHVHVYTVKLLFLCRKMTKNQWILGVITSVWTTACTGDHGDTPKKGLCTPGEHQNGHPH